MVPSMRSFVIKEIDFSVHITCTTMSGCQSVDSCLVNVSVLSELYIWLLSFLLMSCMSYKQHCIISIVTIIVLYTFEYVML